MIDQTIEYERINKAQLVDLVKELQLSSQKMERKLQKLKNQNTVRFIYMLKIVI
jgi:hypothetical protein